MPVSRFSTIGQSGSVLEVKEVLPAAARALRLTTSTLGGTRSGRFREGHSLC